MAGRPRPPDVACCLARRHDLGGGRRPQAHEELFRKQPGTGPGPRTIRGEGLQPVNTATRIPGLHTLQISCAWSLIRPSRRAKAPRHEIRFVMRCDRKADLHASPGAPQAHEGLLPHRRWPVNLASLVSACGRAAGRPWPPRLSQDSRCDFASRISGPKGRN